MAEKVTLKLSAAAAAYARKDAPGEMKLKAARGEIDASDGDMATLLFFLAHDQDPEVRGTAIATMRAMPEASILSVIENGETHPRILDMIAHLHFSNGEIAAKLLEHPATGENTAAFLKEKQAEVAGVDEAGDGGSEPILDEAEPEEEESGEMPKDEAVDEESEEFLSKYKLSLTMDVSEKIKVALTGDKEWRTLMIRDSNKLVASAVVKNPRITDGEILALAQSAIQHDEIMRLICGNKEWIKNYQIRKALVQNCKTPLPAALRFMSTLMDKDLASLAKSKNVPSVIATQARRQLMNKKKH